MSVFSQIVALDIYKLFWHNLACRSSAETLVLYDTYSQVLNLILSFIGSNLFGVVLKFFQVLILMLWFLRAALLVLLFPWYSLMVFLMMLVLVLL